MQQLLHMMQKITAEPNNNAKVQTSNPSSQIISTDEYSADESSETGIDKNREDGSAEQPEINSETDSENDFKSSSDVSEGLEADVDSRRVDGSGSDSESKPELPPEVDSDVRPETGSDNNFEAGSIANPEPVTEDSSNGSFAEVTNDSADLASVPQSSASVEEQNELISTATSIHDRELVSAGQDVVEAPADEFSENDIVVDEPITPAVPKKVGFVKRWVNKAISWVKRLVGF